jgi:hypothetical protein
MREKNFHSVHCRLKFKSCPSDFRPGVLHVLHELQRPDPVRQPLPLPVQHALLRRANPHLRDAGAEQAGARPSQHPQAVRAERAELPHVPARGIAVAGGGGVARLRGLLHVVPAVAAGHHHGQGHLRLPDCRLTDLCHHCQPQGPSYLPAFRILVELFSRSNVYCVYRVAN